jgi:hypothetical protein
MAGQQQRRGQEELVATYTDRRKRRHRIVLRDRLVLDLCARRPAAVVAELSPEEGLDQAIGAVFGGEFDPGYIARAEAGEGTLVRRLRAEDLDARQPADAAECGDDRDQIDDDRRLAA